MDLGVMKHNTVLLNWPTNNKWRSREILTSSQRFVDTIRSATAAKLAILLAKNADDFLDNNTKMSGKVGVWWIVHDGGMLMLLPFLLPQHQAWKNTQLRVFTMAQYARQFGENARRSENVFVQFADRRRSGCDRNTRVGHFRFHLREETLRTGQRSKMLRELGLSKKEKSHEISISAPTYSQASQSHLGLVPNGRTAAQDSSALPSKFFGLQSYNVRRMHTAVKLNEIFPPPPAVAHLLSLIPPSYCFNGPFVGVGALMDRFREVVLADDASVFIAGALPRSGTENGGVSNNSADNSRMVEIKKEFYHMLATTVDPMQAAGQNSQRKRPFGRGDSDDETGDASSSAPVHDIYRSRRQLKKPAK